MKKILTLVVLSLLCCMAFAQIQRGAVSGKLTGKKSGRPLDYVAVSLTEASSRKIVNGTITDSLGVFRIEGIKNGTYVLKFSYVGCADYLTPAFSISPRQESAAFDNIVIDDSGLYLGGAVITGQRSTYMQSIDKKIFNVGSDITSGSGTLGELLQNVPSVQVDVDGNVSLRGNSNVQILINGKPSVLMKGANRGNVLQQYPASTIERIEVITNPSAQFKPDGTSGIINLILKKDRLQGLSGSVIGNIGNNGRYNGSLILNWNTRKFGVSASYGYRVDRRDRMTYNNRTLTDQTTGEKTFVTQINDSRALSRSHIGTLGLQWNPTAKDAFETGVSYTYMTFPRFENNNTVQKDAAGITKNFTRFRNDNEVQQEAEGSAAYTHTFRPGETMLLDYTFAPQDEVENNHYTNSYTVPSVTETKDNTLIRQRTYENLVRLIYSNEIDSRNTVVAGYEAELDRSIMKYYAEDLVGNSWVKNSNRSNDFLFHENVHSLYSTWEHHFDRFSFMAGIRGEQSFITSNLVTLNQIVNNNYFMLYPTVHTSLLLGDRMELQFNYSLRVNRPEGDDLNPFPEYQDLYNVRAGNPHLLPEKIHSFELGLQYKSGVTTLIMTPYFRHTFNKMTDITKVLGDGVIMTTRENMSSSNAAGTEFVVNSFLGRWCNFNFSSNLFYNTIDASDLGYSSKRSAWAWYASMNADLTPFKNFIFQINTRYNSSVLTPQGKELGTYIMNLGAKYDMPKINLSFTATVSDLFDSYRSTTVVSTPAISQTVERRRAPRIVYLGFCYKFGGNANRNTEGQKLNYDETL